MRDAPECGSIAGVDGLAAVAAPMPLDARVISITAPVSTARA